MITSSAPCVTSSVRAAIRLTRRRMSNTPTGRMSPASLMNISRPRKARVDSLPRICRGRFRLEAVASGERSRRDVARVAGEPRHGGHLSQGFLRQGATDRLQRSPGAQTREEPRGELRILGVDLDNRVDE